jgi:hypothetical protein
VKCFRWLGQSGVAFFKDIVIGNNITCVVYFVGSNMQLDGRRTDSLYLLWLFKSRTRWTTHLSLELSDMTWTSLRTRGHYLYELSFPLKDALANNSAMTPLLCLTSTYSVSAHALIMGRNRFSCIPQIPLLSMLVCIQWIRWSPCVASWGCNRATSWLFMTITIQTILKCLKYIK